MTTAEAIAIAAAVKPRRVPAARIALEKLQVSRTDALRKKFDGIEDDVDELRKQIDQIEVDLNKVAQALNISMGSIQ